MRVLLLTPSLPYPPHQGGAIRNYGLLRGLHDAGHSVCVLSFHQDSLDPAATPLAEICEWIETVPPPDRPQSQRLRDMALSGLPDLARRLDSPLFRERLEARLSTEKFDLVQFEGLEMTPYLALVRKVQPRARCCYDAHNAEYALQWAIFHVDRYVPERLPAAAYSMLQARRIHHYERAVCAAVDCVIAVSEEDAASLRPFRADKRVAVVPNGIFADRYGDDSPRLDLGSNVLVFTGKMDYRPNIDAVRWFSDNILPLVSEAVPDVRLYIVGQKPHASLESLRDQPHVELTGWVPDVQPFLQAADVYVAPLRMGSGTRLKILEAMAAGCAVVATTVAASGLDKQAKRSLILADDERAFAQAVVALLHDADRRTTLGQAAQADVRRLYDWKTLIPCLLQTYEDIGLG